MDIHPVRGQAGFHFVFQHGVFGMMIGWHREIHTWDGYDMVRIDALRCADMRCDIGIEMCDFYVVVIMVFMINALC